MSTIKHTLIDAIKEKDGKTFLSLFNQAFTETEDKQLLAKDIAEALFGNLPQGACNASVRQPLEDSWRSQGLDSEAAQMVLEALMRLL